MRAVIQRVTRASVSVNSELISSINNGLCVLIGISKNDTKQDMEWMVRKILNLRIFDDDSGKRWSASVKDKNYEILCVSQFTLYAVLKGNKPDYHNSMGPEDSKAFYDEFISKLCLSYKLNLVKDGVFGAYMSVNIENDGPVTIDLESPFVKQKVTADDAKTDGDTTRHDVPEVN